MFVLSCEKNCSFKSLTGAILPKVTDVSLWTNTVKGLYSSAPQRRRFYPTNNHTHMHNSSNPSSQCTANTCHTPVWAPLWSSRLICHHFIWLTMVAERLPDCAAVCVCVCEEHHHQAAYYANRIFGWETVQIFAGKSLPVSVGNLYKLHFTWMLSCTAWCRMQMTRIQVQHMNRRSHLNCLHCLSEQQMCVSKPNKPWLVFADTVDPELHCYAFTVETWAVTTACERSWSTGSPHTSPLTALVAK